MMKHNLHSGYSHPVTRLWHDSATRETDRLVFPVFLTQKPGLKEPIAAMPGQYRWSPDRVVAGLEPLVDAGLRSVLLFGVIEQGKDSEATAADRFDNPVVQTIPLLREAFPDLLIATDVCLCAYTNHGHCAILSPDGKILNAASIQRLAEIAGCYAQAGAHVVAPSDMMDGRVGAIARQLDELQRHDVAILSYSAKFASAFYGPFRDAAKSAPSHGNRAHYQLPPAARGLAIQATARDIDEGADFVMVKPALPYLDILREIKDTFGKVTAAYQVSGEYAMIHHAAKAGALDLKAGVLESWIGLRRAGADVIISYFASELLEWL